MLPTPASTASTSGPLAPLAFNHTQPIKRLDTDALLERVNREREEDLDRLEELLQGIYELRDDFVVSIYNRITKLQFEQRATLKKLYEQNTQCEVDEATEKQNLATFVDGVSATFTRLFGSAPAPFAHFPNALISVDPRAPVPTMDGEALVAKINTGESEDLDRLEELLKGVHELFDDYAAAIVRRWDALDTEQAKELDGAIVRIKQQEDEQELHRQSIATLFDTVRSAFENFQALQASC
ncbi:hypothetical protein JCM10450v2_003695 [Rhodotorula kratochvilovae]